MKQLLRQVILILSCFYAATIPAYAQGDRTNIASQVNTTIFNPRLGDYITTIINTAFIIGAIATLALLIIGAIRWITSGGEKSNYEAARSMITSALIGLVVLASTWAIWFTVLHILGLSSIPGLQTGGSGGGSSSGSSSWCGSREWKDQYAGEHGGTQPNNSTDVTACNASQPYATRCGKVSTAAWNYYTAKGNFPGSGCL